jgi:hypothetical protein
MRLQELIRFYGELLSSGARLAAAAGDRVKTAGLKKHLLSVSQHEKENEARVAEWDDALPSTEGEREINFAVDRPVIPDDGDLKGDDRRILTALLEQKKNMEELFARAAAFFQDSEAGIFFQGLSEDEKKQKALLQDRFDLLGLM